MLRQNFNKHRIMCAGCLLLMIFVLMSCSTGKTASRGDVMHAQRGLEKSFAAHPHDKQIRLELAQSLFETGDFTKAKELLVPLVSASEPLSEAVLLLAQVEFLHGRYDAAEQLLLTCVDQAKGDVWQRLEPELYLVFVYYQTNQYAKSHTLFNNMEPVFKKVGDSLESITALWQMMKTFDQTPPYQIRWQGKEEVRIPFLQTSEYELPVVAVEINGKPVQAYIDTGGDLFSIPQEIAASLGIASIASVVGTYAGGKQAETGYGRAASLKIGDVMLRNIPVAIASREEKCCLGTNVLRQFLATLDYPNHQLILRANDHNGRLALQRELAGMTVTEIPFLVMATHYIVAQGRLNDRDHLMFLVDSGLEDDTGAAAFAAPAQTLRYANLPLPKTSPITGDSGAGNVTLDVGYFPIETLGLGSLVHKNVHGGYGIFPPDLYDALGFLVDGLISHNYLRQYAWTLDFSTMTMFLAQ